MLIPELSVKPLLLNLLLSGLSFLVPKKKGLLLFAAGRGTVYKGNPKYIFEYLIDKPDIYSPLWITESQTVYELLLSKGFPVADKYTLKGFLAILRAEYIIIDFSLKDFSYMGTLPGRFDIIQTWHGIALKYIGLKELDNHEEHLKKKLSTRIFAAVKRYFQEKEYRSYKYFIAGSETEAENIKVSFNITNTVVTGFPRNDLLFEKPSKTKRNISGIKADKIFLYAPTFRDTGYLKDPFTNAFLLKMDAYLKKNNYLLIVKKHPHDKNLNISGYQRIVDVSETYDDIQELLPLIDLLITDYSSVFFDFCLTEKPVIYYPYDYDYYIESCRGMYFDYYETLPGPFAHDEEELFKLLKTADKWSAKVEYKNKYNDFKILFHKYTDSFSTKRIIELLKYR